MSKLNLKVILRKHKNKEQASLGMRYKDVPAK